MLFGFVGGDDHRTELGDQVLGGGGGFLERALVNEHGQDAFLGDDDASFHGYLPSLCSGQALDVHGQNQVVANEGGVGDLDDGADGLGGQELGQAGERGGDGLPNSCGDALRVADIGVQADGDPAVLPDTNGAVAGFDGDIGPVVVRADAVIVEQGGEGCFEHLGSQGVGGAVGEHGGGVELADSGRQVDDGVAGHE